MRQVKACGVLLFRKYPERAFLLMQHRDRLDLPKGHVEEDESEIQCALREFEEETGIPRESVQIDPHFRFESHYQPREKRYNNEIVDKTLVIFLGYLDRDVPIVATEHIGFVWVSWNPPHRLQAQTIDPLLAAVEQHLQTGMGAE
jgi:8-oxo-dGTP pyrophosphatase MutT (NUDIX family)